MPDEISVSKISAFLKGLNNAEFIYTQNVIGLASSIRGTIKEFGISEKEFCEEMSIEENQYDSYFKGAINYNLHDVARLESLRLKKLDEISHAANLKNAEVATVPKYKYSEPINP